MNKALLSSKNMCWCTPQDFFDKLNEEFSFTLDAAATDKTAKCPLYFTPETDGLKSSWKVAGGGTVFCNPPYGREIGKWVQKAYEEAQAGTPIVLLIPARTDTSYFHDFMLKIRRIKTDRFRTAAFWIEKWDNEYIACRTLVNALFRIASPSIMSIGQEALKTWRI